MKFTLFSAKAVKTVCTRSIEESSLSEYVFCKHFRRFTFSTTFLQILFTFLRNSLNRQCEENGGFTVFLVVSTQYVIVRFKAMG